MTHAHIDKHRPALAALVLLVLASLTLADCGGSSKGSSTSATASAATSAAAGGSDRAARFKALRECLAKDGVPLPQRPLRGGMPGGGMPGGAGPQLPKGMTREQYEAAVKKCGGLPGGFPGARSRLNSAPFKQALSKFAACMRQNGVALPEPDTSGNGPIFNTKGLDTASARFRTAQAKCRSQLRTVPPGRPGRAGPGGAPPAGVPAPPGGVAQPG